MGTDYTVAHAAALAAKMPRESACVREVVPEAAWDDEVYLLAAIEYDLRMLVWQNSKDGAKGRNKPKRPQTPADVERVKRKVSNTDIAAVTAALSGWEEARDG